MDSGRFLGMRSSVYYDWSQTMLTFRNLKYFEYFVLELAVSDERNSLNISQRAHCLYYGAITSAVAHYSLFLTRFKSYDWNWG